MNGRCGSDAGIGDYTFISTSGASLVDYVIASSFLFNHVANFDIPSRADSAHLPITVSLRTLHPLLLNDTDSFQNEHVTDFKFVWDINQCETFRKNLLSEEVQNLLYMSQEEARVNIDKSVDCVVEALSLAACGMKRDVKNRNYKKMKKAWFDKECENLKQQRCKALNRFRRLKDIDSLQDYKRIRNK